MKESKQRNNRIGFTIQADPLAAEEWSTGRS